MSTSTTSSSASPNIVVFLTDDHGPWGANCLGTPSLYTPAMDELARTGARLTRAYTPSPVCSPGRASFYTGRIPSMHGIHDHLAEKSYAKDHPGICDQPTIAQHLSESGYHTAHIGKWHCGRSWARQGGFQHWDAIATGPRFGDVKYRDHGSEETSNQRGYRDELVGDRAVRFLRERERDGGKDRPFFLSIAFTATHSPFAHHPERLVNQYREAAARDLITEPADGRHWVRVGPTTREEDVECHAQYYAAITEIDEQVGRVMDTLDGLGERENTLIVYTSDHGHNNGHHGIWRKGNATVPQNFYEESVGVPHLVSWPERIVPGRTHAHLVDHCDLFATLLDAAGLDSAAVCEKVRSPGRSYLPLLTGASDEPIKEVQFCEYGNARMARSRRYKLIRRYLGPNGHFPDELYDLTEDPRERRNRIDDPECAAVIEALSQKLDAHFAQYEDPDHSGVRVGEFEPVNGIEPWRTSREHPHYGATEPAL